MSCVEPNLYDVVELQLASVEVDGVEVDPSGDYGRFDVTMEQSQLGGPIRTIYVTEAHDVWMELYQ